MDSQSTDPVPPAGDKPKTSQGLGDTLQLLARLGALLLAVAYGAGFVILLVYHSIFKIADFGLVQPRILATGFLFLFLLALPCVAISRTFAFFGLTTRMGKEVVAKPENAVALKVFLALNFYVVSCWFSTMCRFLLRVEDPRKY